MPAAQENANKPKAFRWTEPRSRAAVLLAEDAKTDAEIAAEVGVDPATLWRWKQDPAFAAAVGDHVGALQAAVLRYRIARKRERVRVLDDLHTKALAVIDERAAEYAAMAADDAAQPTLTGIRNLIGHREVPAGGGTGLIVREIKQIGSGRDAQLVEQYGVDTGLMREIRALHEQAAKELGQWVDRSEVSQTQTIQIVGIDAEAI